ncbi:right-handed parallel beta-helix repeat-containing protein [Planomicrobium sp. CPCC 101079]|uniref:DUF1565 domain-containing protein n=1 Tax=Planomicrobium sp. CPCC 101079 TaxID=2599618 RepID=UPI0011B5EA24|nr:right-handed parallel beta-helix repeat-containing protein [Planomicrobium sp. CPCC 101079]TWT00165.1 DUF1565 domain-containing protein [Planomicrobium sp. CPCC 101079]
MKKLAVVFLAATIIALTIMSLNSNEEKQSNIYVAINGNDEEAGTLSKPLRTLQQAALVAKAGTTVHVREGIYKEKLVIQHSGTEAKPIIFKSYQNEKVVLSGENIKSEEGDTSIITIDDKNYVTVSGFTIQDLSTNLADETVMGIFITGASSHILMDSNHIQRIETHSAQGNGHGIAVYGTGSMKNIRIINNMVEDLKLGASEALVLNGNIDRFEITGNLVRRNDNIGIDLIGYEGVSLDKNADYVRNGIVNRNKVYDISSYGNPAYGKEYSAAGIYVDGGRDIMIEENTVYHNDIGIEAASEHKGKFAANIEIFENVIYENFYTGIAIGGYDEQQGGIKNSRISKNILYRNDTKGMGGGQLMLQHDIRANKIEKNILTAGPSHIFIANYFITGENNKLNQNVFHKESERKGIWIWGDEEFTSFSAFKSVSGSDKGTMYIDPKYVDSSDYNFRLETNSPVRGIFESEE